MAKTGRPELGADEKRKQAITTLLPRDYDRMERIRGRVPRATWIADILIAALDAEEREPGSSLRLLAGDDDPKRKAPKRRPSAAKE